MLHINDNEIFYTLVEYGRGRGNYFYATNSKSKGLNLTQSYIPELTDMELNFLHKVTNIGRYLGIPADTAIDANWICQYPDNTVIRNHNVLTLARSGIWTAGYNIEEVETSWERMGYLSMQIDSGQYSAGQQIAINCTGVSYAIDSGIVKVDSDNFTLSVVSREPISVTAYPEVATVNSGTTEVPITYVIKNAQTYDLTELAVEIQAPMAGQFIGTRGELWGTSEDRHRVEFATLAAGQEKNITLVARFDTSTWNPLITDLNASKGIQVQFIAPWEAHAYNPAKYVQNIQVTQTITWNQLSTSSIVGVQSALIQINNTINEIDSIVNQINSTATSIQSAVNQINSTVNAIQTVVNEINTTSHNVSDTLQQTVIPNLETIKGYTQNLQNLIIDAIHLIDCTNSTAGSVCDRLLVLNSTANAIVTNIDQINTSVNTIITSIANLNANMDSNFTQIFTNLTAISNQISSVTTDIFNMNTTVNNIYSDTTTIKNMLNCTVDAMLCTKLDNITNIVAAIDTNITINGNIDELLNIARYINETRWGNYTAADLVSNMTVDLSSLISQLNINTTEILKRVRLSKEFSEELVFLITDSVNSQISAKEAISNNDFTTAVQSLQKAQGNLEQANTLLLQEKEDLLAAPQTNWVLLVAIVGIVAAICLLGLFYYRLRYPKEAATVPKAIQQPAKEIQ
jgi:archaellum component FlaC